MVRSVEARAALDVSRRLKQYVGQIYCFAIPQGWAERDPAEHLGDLLKVKPRVRHMPWVGVDELPALVRANDGYDGDGTPRRRAVTRAALLFTLLTWARTNETRLATWDEFEGLDTPEPLWRVPTSRMSLASSISQARHPISGWADRLTASRETASQRPKSRSSIRCRGTPPTDIHTSAAFLLV